MPISDKLVAWMMNNLRNLHNLFDPVERPALAIALDPNLSYFKNKKAIELSYISLYGKDIGNIDDIMYNALWDLKKQKDRWQSQSVHKFKGRSFTKRAVKKLLLERQIGIVKCIVNLLSKDYPNSSALIRKKFKLQQD